MTGPLLPDLDRPKAFAAPWEAQAFALVVKLHERGLFEWPEFAARLSAEIHAHPDQPYYVCWHEAAVELLVDKGLVEAGAFLDQARAVVRFRASDHHHVARLTPIAVDPARAG
ncbi:nitrile hydratase accessory protein [Ancylobacter sp. Lp-2]|uniref:nitrile hydratase accessory protein n=1 Tax=Ancylobacter sp. Lp-2 TaxID=2881339 RepID=UPI001E56C91B|nr:nitrile hydratase accessory protein [Ancylobacter sp. Lp-2]